MDIQYRGRLDEDSVTFYRAFGYLVFRGFFDRDEMRVVDREFSSTMTDEYPGAVFDPTAGPERQRRRWAVLMDQDTPFHASLLEDGRLVSLARQLSGGEVLGIKVQGNRFGGDTPWHRDTYTSSRGGIKFIWYHQAVDRQSGALRLVPTTHLLGDDYLFAEKLRRLPIRDAPAAVLPTDPGDMIAFDMRIWHGSCGGVDRSESSVTYYNEPRSEAEEEALRLRARTNIEILLDEFGPRRDYFYSKAWIANEGGSDLRARWIDRLQEIGYFDAPRCVEP